MKICSLCAMSFITTAEPLRACLEYGRKAGNLDQWDRSVLSLAPQLSCFVMKPYLFPMISPSKYVVSVGWSSVSPCKWVDSQQQDQEKDVFNRGRNKQTLDAEVAAEE